MAPYWQSDNSSYSFIAVTHPSLAGLADQVGIKVQAIRKNGTLFGSSKTFTIDRGTTRTVFILRPAHPIKNTNKWLKIFFMALSLKLNFYNYF